MGKIEQPARQLMLLGIRAYRYALSPFLAPCCRFWPSCSDYTIQAIQQHGCIKGGWLGIKRILKCHPWHAGGFDPVPPANGNHCCNPERRTCTDD